MLTLLSEEFTMAVIRARRDEDPNKKLRKCPKPNHGDYHPPFSLPETINQCPICGYESTLSQEVKDREAQKELMAAMRNEEWMKQIPDRHKSAKLETPIRAPEAHKNVMSRARSLVKNWSTIEGTGKSAFIHGVNGAGKSTILCGVVIALNMRGVRAEYVTQSSICARYRDSYRDDATESESSIIKHYKSVPLLALDEVGGGKGTPAELNFIAELIVARHENQKCTLIGTNFDAAKMLRDFGRRVAERIATWQDMACDWGSYRLPESNQ